MNTTDYITAVMMACCVGPVGLFFVLLIAVSGQSKSNKGGPFDG